MSRDQYGMRYEEGFGPESDAEDYHGWTGNEPEADYAHETGLQATIGSVGSLFATVSRYRNRFDVPEQVELDNLCWELVRDISQGIADALAFERKPTQPTPLSVPKAAPYPGLLPDEFYYQLAEASC